jgi:hypothetical protein
MDSCPSIISQLEESSSRQLGLESAEPNVSILFLLIRLEKLSSKAGVYTYNEYCLEMNDRTSCAISPEQLLPADTGWKSD